MARNATVARAQSLGFAARIGAWVDSPTQKRADGKPRKEFLALNAPRAVGETAKIAVFDADGKCVLALGAVNTPSRKLAMVESLRAALTLAENYTPTDSEPAPKAPAAPKDAARSNGPVTILAAPMLTQPERALVVTPAPTLTPEQIAQIATQAALAAVQAALGQAPTPAPASPAPAKARKGAKLTAAAAKEEFAF